MHKFLSLSFRVSDASRFHRLISLFRFLRKIAEAALIEITAPLQNVLHVISRPPKLIPITRQPRPEHPCDSRVEH